MEVGREVIENASKTDSGRVFVDALCRPLHPGVVSRTFRALVKRVEPPDITLHGMRQTHITVAPLRLGPPTGMASRRVGHANEALTPMMHTEWLPRHDQQAAVQVAGLVVPRGF